MLGAGAWGWHIETGLHALRLILAGVFDRFPALQLIIGHMGEVLPFMIARATTCSAARTRSAASARAWSSPAEYFMRNFHITTSGFFTDPPLRCALDMIGADRILFAVDHPFGDNATARRFLDGAAITDEEREKIAHANAERLLGL